MSDHASLPFREGREVPSQVKLSRSQREVLNRVADGGVLIVCFQRSGSGVQQTCRIGGLEPHPMTVNALIVAGFLAPQDEVRGENGGRTVSYAVSYAGQRALRAP